MLSLCNNWEFTREWSESFAAGEGSGEAVRLPHTVQEMPLHYGDHTAYQFVCGYRRKLELDEKYAGKRLFLQFDGAAHIATVYVNGQELATHRCGYTAFRVEITKQVQPGENTIAVKLDTGFRVVVCEDSGDGWVRIRGGSFTGYVKEEYLVYED